LDSIEDAHDYLENLEDRFEEREEEEYMTTMDEEYRPVQTEEETFASFPDKVSISKLGRENHRLTIKEEFERYERNGFVVTYEGKTGYTLERV